MEALSRMIYAMVKRGLLSGFSVGPLNVGAFNISHLLFVDDTLIFCGTSPDHLQNLRCLFLCFEVVLGLRINLAKSDLVPVGNVNNVEGLAGILGYRVSSLPMKYLGLPVGASFKAKSKWDGNRGIIKKIERCLAGWKRIYLSKGGRVTLIKSTLSNLFPLLVGVANRIEKLQRNFMWGGIGEEFEFYFVS